MPSVALSAEGTDMKVAENRVCPIHNTDLIYWPKGDDFACQDVNCKYGHGMRLADPPSLFVVVVNADEMYDDDFVKHFNLRHDDQLGGLNEILLVEDEYTIELFREFHHKLHNSLLFPFAKINHEHGE